MSTTTSNLSLFKYNVADDGNLTFSITNALNNNWNIIDDRCVRHPTSTAVGNTIQPVYISNTGNATNCSYSIEPTRFDGQWVSSTKTLSTATAVGTYTIDLSDYLPNDNYNYEIQLHLNCSFKSTSGTIITMNGLSFYTGDASQTSSGSEYKTTNGLAIIDTTRILTMVISSEALRSLSLESVMYRRIGTNT